MSTEALPSTVSGSVVAVAAAAAVVVVFVVAMEKTVATVFQQQCWQWEATQMMSQRRP